MIKIRGNALTLEQFIAVTRDFEEVELAQESLQQVRAARAMVDDCVNREAAVYGITTGFGKLCNVSIPREDTKALQKNLIMSHACGVGEVLPEDAVRGMMLLRANNLVRGFSGAREETIQCLVDMLNQRVYPAVYEQGSLGASGDLVPLAHMTLVMLGLGEAFVEGKKVSGKEAMERAGLSPIELCEKEGLAMINGTQALTSIGALATYDAILLAKCSDIIGALTTESLFGIIDAFSPLVSMVRSHGGQAATGRNLLRLLEDSRMTTRQGELRVQDPYSIRCMPQIHGASKDTISYVKEKVEIEINSVTDNPLIFFNEGEIISAGNFHGEPMAQPFDFLAIGVSELANISERRLERLVNPAMSEGLPPFLAEKGGMHSGYMIAQYAAASLVSENKILAHPASVDSIPSSAGQEDLVSMGTVAARKARKIVANTRNVLAIELLIACQALDMRGNVSLGKGTQRAYEILRREIPYLDKDREHYKDIHRAETLLEEILTETEKAVGLLEIQ